MLLWCHDRHSVVRWEEAKNKVTFKSLVSAAKPLRQLNHPLSSVGRLAPEDPYQSIGPVGFLSAPSPPRSGKQENRVFGPVGACTHKF
ncbi:hypothetical protein TNCV_1303961 [Trichonephila clavipes]|nr:hypothetical protein TNCV_1303961 [Trichonephila clavipes]